MCSFYSWTFAALGVRKGLTSHWGILFYSWSRRSDLQTVVLKSKGLEIKRQIQKRLYLREGKRMQESGAGAIVWQVECLLAHI